jgi:hypothetical protein
MAQISAALVAEHSTWQGAREAVTAAMKRGSGTPCDQSISSQRRLPYRKPHASENKGAGTQPFSQQISQD